ncbi:hypothetical protein POM88_023280 [Heracleum sosnowskyi]|uniref:Uncharacterized protein n=1 Tax=Heracleum sosnowskyi TaxID=360622 RepID=A0AAD8MQB9_9APIA|nr:hypothetical protein POM88_023280 [Heracleum sosnowskyi]
MVICGVINGKRLMRKWTIKNNVKLNNSNEADEQQTHVESQTQYSSPATEISHPCVPSPPVQYTSLLLGVGNTMGQATYPYPDPYYRSIFAPYEAQPYPAQPYPTQPMVCEATGKGFYDYNDKHEASPDSEVQIYVEKSRIMSGISVDPKLSIISDKEIIEMILFPVVNEACRVYVKGLAVKTTDLDIVGVMAMGFPAYRGGVMFWGDFFGSKFICYCLHSETLHIHHGIQGDAADGKGVICKSDVDGVIHHGIQGDAADEEDVICKSVFSLYLMRLSNN